MNSFLYHKAYSPPVSKTLKIDWEFTNLPWKYNFERYVKTYKPEGLIHNSTTVYFNFEAIWDITFDCICVETWTFGFIEN